MTEQVRELRCVSRALHRADRRAQLECVSGCASPPKPGISTADPRVAWRPVIAVVDGDRGRLVVVDNSREMRT